MEMFMRYAMTALILLFSFHLSFAQDFFFQFPEAKTYISYEDTGFSQYLAKSLHHTKKLALTFDDGPHPTRTPKLLDTLKKYQVKVTFFILAEKINSQSRAIIQRIINEGHTLASHDWDHTNSNSQSAMTFQENLTKSILAVEEEYELLGLHKKEMYYRFPYGDYGRHKKYHHLNVLKDVSQELYNENCINFAFWDIDTADWVKDMTPQNISDNIMAQVFGGVAYRHKAIRNSQGQVIDYKKEAYQVEEPLGGGVVLMHDIHQRTIESVDIFLKEAKEKGIEIVPLSDAEEFSYENKECILKV